MAVPLRALLVLHCSAAFLRGGGASLCFEPAGQCAWCHIRDESLTCGIPVQDTPAPSTPLPPTPSPLDTLSPNTSTPLSAAPDTPEPSAAPMPLLPIKPLDATCTFGTLGATDVSQVCWANGTGTRQPNEEPNCVITATPWSKCSVLCGGGAQTRNITATKGYGLPAQAGTPGAGDGACTRSESFTCNRRPCGKLGRMMKVQDIIIAPYAIKRMPPSPGNPGGLTPIRGAAVASPANGIKVSFADTNGNVRIMVLNGSNALGGSTFAPGGESRGVTESAALVLTASNKIELLYDPDILARGEEGVALAAEAHSVDPSVGWTRIAEASPKYDPNISRTALPVQVLGVFSAAHNPAESFEHGDFERYFDVYRNGSNGAATFNSPSDYAGPSENPSMKDWRCAPGGGQQMIFHAGLEMFVSACVQKNVDCSSGACVVSATGNVVMFSSGRITPGVSFNKRQGQCCDKQDGRRITDPKRPSVVPDIGAMIATPAGVLFAYTVGVPASESCGGTGGGSYNGKGNLATSIVIATEGFSEASQEWGVARNFDLSGSLPAAQRCLAKTHLRVAHFPTGKQEDATLGEYLIGWATDEPAYYLASLGVSDGNVTLSTPERVDSWAVWGAATDWVTTTEGEVAWVHAWDMTWPSLAEPPGSGDVARLKVVRLRPSFEGEINASPLLRCQGQSDEALHPSKGCSETYLPATKTQDHSDRLSTTVIISSCLVAGILLVYVGWWVRKRRTRLVGSNNRGRVSAMYPWDDKDAKDVEYIELPKQGS